MEMLNIAQNNWVMVDTGSTSLWRVEEGEPENAVLKNADTVICAVTISSY